MFWEFGHDFINGGARVLAAPEGIAPSITKRLDDAVRKAMDKPEFIQYMEKQIMMLPISILRKNKKYLEKAYVRLGKSIIQLEIPKELEKK